jgi:hypothetical protein
MECRLLAVHPWDLGPQLIGTVATQANLENVRITAGEYNTADMVAEFDHLIEPVAGDVMAKTQYRGSIIVFCPRVDTCEKMREALAQRGLPNRVTTDSVG